MTKEQYIKAHPKSKLASRLASNNWADDTVIEVIGGLDAPYNPTSNLYKALKVAKLKRYILGGHRQRGTEGWWIAVT